jgi:hypothetical protein
MGLAEMFRDLATQMLVPGGIFDNVPVNAVYYSGTVGNSATYDPVTQVVTVNETAYTISGVIDKPEYKAIDNINVFPEDRWFYVAGNVFRDAGLTTRNKPHDRVEFTNGTSWNVVRILSDPVDACFIIQMRNA